MIKKIVGLTMMTTLILMSCNTKKETKSEDPYEFWNLKKGDTPVDLSEKRITEELIVPKEDKSESDSSEEIHVSFEDDSSDEVEEEYEENLSDSSNSKVEVAVGLVTHTLVDLYCGQGHIEKALEVLEKILILNPTDAKTINKILEIKALIGPFEVEEKIKPIQRQAPTTKLATITSQKKPNLEALKEISEEDGRKNLMSILDKQLGSANEPLMKEIAKGLNEDKKSREALTQKKLTSPAASKTIPNHSKSLQKTREIEERLTEFLKKIQKRALDYQARF